MAVVQRVQSDCKDDFWVVDDVERLVVQSVGGNNP